MRVRISRPGVFAIGDVRSESVKHVRVGGRGRRSWRRCVFFGCSGRELVASEGVRLLHIPFGAAPGAPLGHHRSRITGERE